MKSKRGLINKERWEEGEFVHLETHAGVLEGYLVSRGGWQALILWEMKI